MRERILKYMLYAGGVICLAIFVLVRFNHMPSALIVDLDNYGDLYRLNYINKFKEQLPDKKQAFNQSKKHSNFDEADILIFGDSYFNYRRHQSVPEQIADALNKKVFFKQSHFVDLFLHRNRYDSSNRKILILEIAERGIPVKFGTIGKSTRQFQFEFFEKLDTTLFAQKYNEKYRFLLERNKLTHLMYAAINSFNFNQFRYISRSTPKYNAESGWLFYESTVNNKPGSYNYKYSKDEMEMYTNNIIKWRDHISSKYNVEVILYIIPNKSSIYHAKIGNEGYNNFLSQLSNALKRRQLNHISLHKDFMESSDILYYRTDTHWNEKGEKLGADILIEYLKNLN